MPKIRGRSCRIFLPLPLSLSLSSLSSLSSISFPPPIPFYRLDTSTWHACIMPCVTHMACMHHAMCHPHGMHASCHVSPTWHVSIMPCATHMACRHHAMCHPLIWVPFYHEIREILTISELNKIHLGNYISRDESNGEVCFVIQDLEKFQGLQPVL